MAKEFMDVILNRNSVRSYSGEKVPRDDIIKILKAGMSAPSAVNIQPWEFVIVQDKDTLKQLNDQLPYAKMLAQSGTGIVVCGVPDKSTYAKDYWVQDCSAVTQNILLAAHGLGYGTVWTGVYPDEAKMKTVRDILKIPKDIIPLCVIPLGNPKGEQKPIDKFREDIIHFEKW